jgi:tRNA-2-methylthio-N6-dimethylallyladenosine synthase
VPLAVKKERLQTVERVQERISTEINEHYLGRDEEILVEAHQIAGGKHQWRGRNRTNKLVFCPASKTDQVDETSSAWQHRIRLAATTAKPTAKMEVGPGDLVMVRIEKTTPWSLQGHLAMR